MFLPSPERSSQSWSVAFSFYVIVLIREIPCIGILPRSGRGISFVQLNHSVRDNYNVAPTFAWYIPNFIANFLGRSYSTGIFDLEDISVHNGIEHDASLTRDHSFFALCVSTITQPWGVSVQGKIRTLSKTKGNHRSDLSKNSSPVAQVSMELWGSKTWLESLLNAESRHANRTVSSQWL